MSTTTTQDGAGRIIEQTVDNGDGTGTRTLYDETGQPVSVEQVTGLPVEAPEDKNQRTIEDRLRGDLAAMQAIIDTPNASMDTATIRQAIKAEARALRRLIRHALAQFDGTD